MRAFPVPQIDHIDKPTELAIVRRAYAKQLLAHARVDDPRLEAAFAQVHREHFLGLGPWKTFQGLSTYFPTPSDDPIYVYTNDLFGLRSERGINNGQPSLHVALLAGLAIQPGERVLHVGAGSGYYSAILAHLVGDAGHVSAVEIDPELAALATTNLTAVENVAVISGDAATAAFEPVDVIYVNAGFARIPPTWLDGLRDGGRLFFPMTSRSGLASLTAGGTDVERFARLQSSHAAFRIQRAGADFHVSPTVPAIFIAAETPDAASDAALSAALQKGGAKRVTRLYRSDDIPEDRCWLRGEGWCLAYT